MIPIIGSIKPEHIRSATKADESTSPARIGIAC